MDFHLDKVIKCNEKGYRLIHIWEDEWISSKGAIEEKLQSIFNGAELVDFTKPLDRSWYNNLSSDGYALKEATAPELIRRRTFDVPNCGYLIYEKNK